MARRALIAGAGIGGLTAALALAREGFRVEIFERAPALEEFGAGLQLTPNATRVLQRLDVLEAVRGLATAPRAIRILRGGDGAELARLPLEDAERRWGAPYLVVHRADLQRALAEAATRLPNVALHLGTEVAGIGDDDAGVSIGLKRGPATMREAGDVLVGADGLRSLVRERIGLGAAEAPVFSGRVAFRAVVESKRVAVRWSASEVTLHLGDKAHLVHYPLRRASFVNLVAAIESIWRGEKVDHPWDGAADRPALDRAFYDWSREARALVRAAVDWRAWPLYSRPPIAQFSLGPVALLGDAAHPMMPFLAQGAAQAIEDADALARRLAESDDVAEALAAYSGDRAARAARVQRSAFAHGRIYHLSGPFALARDLTMRTLGPRRLLKRYDWLYAA
ncbi:MAG: FAD-dependent monooxygenase [Roseiarcus sp.]|jgi:salicylate hydroxylase